MSAIRKLAASRLLAFFLAFLMLNVHEVEAAAILSSMPFTFVNGTASDATQINANFQQIVTQVNAGAAASGSNADITALNALATPLTQTQGGNVVYLGGTSLGSANAQAVTVTTPSGWTLVPGKRVVFPAGFTNTTATTLAVNGGTATNILKNSSSGLVALAAGDITVGNRVEADYDGTEFVLINHDPVTAATTWPLLQTFTLGHTDAGPATFNGSAAFNGPAVFKEQTLTVSAGSAAWPMASAPDAVVTLTGTTNLAAPTGQAVGSRGQLRITQDATGGRVFTWDTTYVTDRQLVPSIYPGANIDTVFNYWVKAASGAGSIVLTPRTESTPQVIIEDQKTAGTVAQTLTAGADTTRNLNTLVLNYGGLASLSSNQITLPAGTYYVKASAVLSVSASAYGRLIFFDVGSSVNQIIGLAGAGSSGSGPSVVQTLDGVFTITGQKTFELRDRVSTNNALGGQPMNDGRSEVYAHVEITKLS